VKFLSLLGASAAVALVLTTLFLTGIRGGRRRLLLAYLIVLLFGLAGGMWTVPYGPGADRIPLFGILLWGLAGTLLLAAFLGTVARDVDPPPIGNAMWFLVVVLVLAILWGLVAQTG
jgi:hypothetical protein